MISVQHLHKSFGQQKTLDDLSVRLELGQSVSLIGPNGSGKTTFIKCLLGMVLPGGGTILFDGKPICADGSYRNQIGYMPQIGRYPDTMKIRQIVAMMKDLRRSSGCALDEELIEAFDLPRLYDKPMRTLSGGTRQKVSACLAFLFDPPVLILDEPTAGLDPLASELLKAKILREKGKGKLILITSHIMSDLDELTSDVMYLQDGRLQFFGQVEGLKACTGEDKLGRAIAALMSHRCSLEIDLYGTALPLF